MIAGILENLIFSYQGPVFIHRVFLRPGNEKNHCQLPLFPYFLCIKKRNQRGEKTNAQKQKNVTGKKKLLLVVGRAASGKTTLVKEVCRRIGIKMVTSYTTRLMRADSDHEFPDHIFITNEQADQLLADKDNIIAYTENGKYCYFTTTE